MEDLRIGLKNILPTSFFDEDEEILRRVKIEASYAKGLEDQSSEIEQLKKEQSLKFPIGFNFSE